MVKISDLVEDEEIYPRLKVGWLTAYQYAQAMRAGSIFPPVMAGQFEGKLYLIDGWHRVQAKKYLKEEYIDAHVRKFDTKQDMFVESVKLNVTHGRPLSVQEKARIIHKLRDMNFELEQISKIVMVPLDKIELFQTRTIIGPDGKLVYMKSVVAKIGDEEKALGVNMDSFSSRDVKHLLIQIIELLESNIYPFDDPDLKELTAKLYGLLQEKLEVAPMKVSQ